MAKDDYYVIAAKILIYLYRKIKNKEKMDSDYLSPMTKDFPIDENGVRILPAGIDYLKDNSTMRKVCETLKEAGAIFSLFQ